MLDSEFIKSVGASILPAYRMLFAQIAAALATAARTIKAEADGRKSNVLSFCFTTAGALAVMIVLMLSNIVQGFLWKRNESSQFIILTQRLAPA